MDHIIARRDFHRADGDFLLKPESPEVRSERDDEDIRRVVDALTELGGECEGSNELKELLAKRYRVSTRWTLEWLNKARDAGKIILKPKEGKKQGYRIPDENDLIN